MDIKKPIRDTYLQYGKQTIEKDDIEAVVKCMRENKYLTTGPRVKRFEDLIKKKYGYKHAFAVSNGTAALHCSTNAIGITSGDEVIVPAISFVATANCVIYEGGKPIFCDIEEDTMNINPDKIEPLITSKTKAIITVDFAGQLCKYNKIKKIAKKYNLRIIEDGAHSVGVTKLGDADIVTFSFHPVKNITTGEGGMVLTNNDNFAKRIAHFRSHGIDNDYKNRHLHYYNMVELGYNYRITDIQCALGVSQFKKLDKFIRRRNEIANIYNKKLRKFKNEVVPLTKYNSCAYHIFVIKLNKKYNRDKIFKKFKENNIGVNVHYSPIYLHPYYKKKYGYSKGLCPTAEKVYNQIITLPIFPSMQDSDIKDVLDCIELIFAE
jgi:dTDP-4-amino-4,6-dideoxygalactose transaminase